MQNRYTAMWFFWLAMLRKGSGCFASQWYPFGYSECGTKYPIMLYWMPSLKPLARFALTTLRTACSALRRSGGRSARYSEIVAWVCLAMARAYPVTLAG